LEYYQDVIIPKKKKKKKDSPGGTLYGLMTTFLFGIQDITSAGLPRTQLEAGGET